MTSQTAIPPARQGRRVRNPIVYPEWGSNLWPPACTARYSTQVSYIGSTFRISWICPATKGRSLKSREPLHHGIKPDHTKYGESEPGRTALILLETPEQTHGQEHLEYVTDLYMKWPPLLDQWFAIHKYFYFWVRKFQLVWFLFFFK